MIRRLPFPPLTGLLVLTLSACGSGGALTPATTRPATSSATAAIASSASTFVRDATFVRAADPQATIHLSLNVRMRDEAGLLRYAREVNDPHSGNYGRFLSPEAIADRFGAVRADYIKTAAYLVHNGLHVAGWKQRELLGVSGSVGAFSRALHTSFNVYRSDNPKIGEFVAAAHPVAMTDALPITAVGDGAQVNVTQTYLLRPSRGYAGYSPQQMARAFDFTGAYASNFHGTGVNVAIVGTGPISSSDAAYASSLFHRPYANISQVDVNDSGVAAGLAATTPLPGPAYPYSSGFATAPPVSPDANPEDGEAQLDTQTIASLADGANVLFYLAYNPNDCYYATGVAQNNAPCAPGSGVAVEGLALADAEIQQIISDNTADIVSLSYGLGELFAAQHNVGFDASGNGFATAEFATMAAEGMAIFVSSGDSGAYECAHGSSLPNAPLCVAYPSSDPNVVAVGGVTGPLDDSGSLTTPFTAWGYQTFQGYASSGGGISAVFAAPTWQAAAKDIAAIGNGKRTVPDISLMGDPNTGFATAIQMAFSDSGHSAFGSIGGTSLAAPQAAAMWSLVLDACHRDSTCSRHSASQSRTRLGNPAPYFYRIYADPALYASVFNQVFYGDNSSVLGGPGITSPAPVATGGVLGGAYNAGPGYNLVTGLGVPMAGHLINAVLRLEGSTSPVTPN